MAAITYFCDEAAYPQVCASARSEVEPPSEQVWTPWVVGRNSDGGLVVTVALVQTRAGQWTGPPIQPYDENAGVAYSPKLWNGSEWITSTQMDRDINNRLRDWRKTWRVLGTEMPRSGDVGMDAKHAIFSNDNKNFFDPQYNVYLLVSQCTASARHVSVSASVSSSESHHVAAGHCHLSARIPWTARPCGQASDLESLCSQAQWQAQSQEEAH